MMNWGVLPVSLLFASAMAQAAGPRICGLESGSSLIGYHDSVVEIADHASTSIATGLSGLSMIPDVQELIRSVNPAQTCVTAVNLSKNDYQYNEIFAVMTLQDHSGKLWVTPMVYQTASVQAYENTGPKPWVGFARKDLTELVKSALSDLSFAESKADESFSPMSLFAKIFTAPSPAIDESSRGYVYIPEVDKNWATYLVTEFRVIDTGNPFTSSRFTEMGVVQVQESGGRVRSAVIPDFFGFYTKIEKLQSDAEPSDPARHLEVLRGLSQ